MIQHKAFIALAAFGMTCAYAQDISGDWQGSLKAGQHELRLVLKITRIGRAEWAATLQSIDQSPDRGVGLPAASFSFDGSHVKFAISQIHAVYDGSLTHAGASIVGTWTQGASLPLEFHRATAATAWLDPSPHRVQFIEVEKDVRLEVLDWGGTGRPLVLLAGLGNSAHIFDKFAPKLTPAWHVYGITRRGFGASGAPPLVTDAAYSADRLGDDVVAVLDALQLARPVLAGHSIAGEELSSVASRHPGRIAGLIYLDAAYSYAFYDTARGDLGIDLVDLEKKLRQLEPGMDTVNRRQLIGELLESALPAFEHDLKREQQNLPEETEAQSAAQVAPVTQAIMRGRQKYTRIPVPALAIYAMPHATARPFQDERSRAAADARDEAAAGAQASAFEAGVPSARVVRLPHANHYVFMSNEEDVLREMNAFLAHLP